MLNVDVINHHVTHSAGNVHGKILIFCRSFDSEKDGGYLSGSRPLAPLPACRLVALDKSPGVRPVGVGEVVWRIISKSILSVIRHEI